MRAAITNPWLIGIAMICAAALAVAARPTPRLADQTRNFSLERLLPESFGEWTTDKSILPIAVSPDVQAKLDRIYNQVLSRTYVNAVGQRIMLSVAYGGDQSDTMQLHRPEVCYTAQGFQVVRQSLDQLRTGFGFNLPVKRLIAVHGARFEPITYWVVVGNEATVVGLRQKLAQLRYGLTGKVPDGMLVRVSSIDRDDTRAYDLQDRFVRELFEALPIGDRGRVFGQFNPSR